MNIVEFQEKMDPLHRANFCRMLKMKQLPEYLLEEYRQVKMLTDRIDGFLSPGNLAMIAISAGFDPNTGKFCVTEQPVGEIADESGKELADEAADQVVEETLEQPVEQPVVGATGQAQEQPAAQPAESGKFWSNGMPVNVLREDELKQGRIVSVKKPEIGSGKAVQLTVEFEGGETVTVDEDEVDAD